MKRARYYRVDNSTLEVSKIEVFCFLDPKTKKRVIFYSSEDEELSYSLFESELEENLIFKKKKDAEYFVLKLKKDKEYFDQECIEFINLCNKYNYGQNPFVHIGKHLTQVKINRVQNEINDPVLRYFLEHKLYSGYTELEGIEKTITEIADYR